MRKEELRVKESDLKQLRALIQEAQQLQRELNAIPITSDSVKGSSSDYPYIEQTIQIRGIDEKKGKKLQRKLENKLELIQEKVEEMEEWLDGVEDSEMRMILRMMYRNGITQKQIGYELGYDRSAISKKLKKFWDEQ